MSTRRIDMINGPIFSNLVAFSVPLMLSGLLQLMFNAADTIVVGRFAGHSSMAGIGATTSLTNLLINLFIGLSIGVNVVVARHIGAGNKKNVSDAVHTSIALSLVSGLLLAIGGVFLSPILLRMMGTPDDVIGKSVLYMRIIFLGMPFNMLYNFGAAVLRAYGDTKRPLYYLTTAGIINVFANLFFVIVLHMDVAGVAIATVLSQLVSSLLIIGTLMRSQDAIKLYLTGLRIKARMLKEILLIGLPAGLQSILFSISNVIVQSSINSFGTYAIAGNTAAVSLDGFIYVVCNSLTQSTLSFMGQNVGAGKYSRINRIIVESALFSTIVGATMGWVMYLFGTPLLSIYSTNPLVIVYGLLKAEVLFTTYFLLNYEEIMVSALRGLGHSILPMVIAIAGICGVRLLWVFSIFQIHHDLVVLYFCYPVSWAVAALAMTICLVLVRRHYPKTDDKPIA